MTPEELDRQLREISDHERGYRSGIKPDNAAVIGPLHEFVSVGGRPILLSRFGNRAATVQVRSADGTMVTRRSASPYICASRHSRFRDYPLHFHDFVELSYMYDGSCHEVINGRLYGIKTGEVLLVDSDTIHTIAPLGEGDILVNIQVDKRYFTANFFNRLDDDSVVTSFFLHSISKTARHDDFIIFRTTDDRRLRTCMNELICELRDPSPRSSEQIVAGLFSVVMAELVNAYGNDVETVTPNRQSTALSVLRHIEEHYAECTLAETASRFGLSTSGLSKLLKRDVGSTFKELVLRQRMAVASRLLAEEALPVSSVARRVGYQNMTFFYKVFAREFGVMPGEYRQQRLRGKLR